MKASTPMIRDLVTFLKAITSYPPEENWIYRGQAVGSWLLRPKAGRKEYYSHGGEVETHDLMRFEEWRQQAIAFSAALPNEDFACLACAQHYGLATRFLDWTTNPLVALYFAVETNPKANGAVYVFRPSRFINPNKDKLDSFADVAVYRPRPFDRRISSQSAVFTYHSRPLIPMKTTAPKFGPRNRHQKVLKLLVPHDAKHRLRVELAGIGVIRKALFPDLDGLSAFVNWQTTVLVSRNRA